jgi:hypothetical protein
VVKQRATLQITQRIIKCMPDYNQVNAGGLMNSSRCTSRLLVLILLHKPVESMGLTSSAQLSFICSKLRASSMTQSAN